MIIAPMEFIACYQYNNHRNTDRIAVISGIKQTTKKEHGAVKVFKKKKKKKLDLDKEIRESFLEEMASELRSEG